MEIVFEEDIRKKSLLDVAQRMLIAARTAPKGKGVDNLVLSIAQEDTIKEIASKMKEMAANGQGPHFYVRDADNLLSSDVLVLIGTKIRPIGVKYCGICGHRNCEEKQKYPDQPCAFNTGDLGIAVGSAVSIAMDSRVDNRVMRTIGMAVRELGLLGREVKIIYGIPLSSSGKNIFFDRD